MSGDSGDSIIFLSYKCLVIVEIQLLVYQAKGTIRVMVFKYIFATFQLTGVPGENNHSPVAIH